MWVGAVTDSLLWSSGAECLCLHLADIRSLSRIQQALAARDAALDRKEGVAAALQEQLQAREAALEALRHQVRRCVGGGGERVKRGW